MYWLCPHLQKSGRDIFHTLSNILKRILDPDPLVALFGITDGEDPHLTFPECRMVAFASLLARRTVFLSGRLLPRPHLVRDPRHPVLP